MNKIVITESDIKGVIENILNNLTENHINEGLAEVTRELNIVKQSNRDMLGHLKMIKAMLEGNNPAHTKNFIIGYINGTIKEAEYNNNMAKGRSRPNDFISEDLTEGLSYQEFKYGEKLKALRNAIDRNQTVSVVFVKKDGTVRPMAIRKYFNYKFKTDSNIQSTIPGFSDHKDFYNVFDINVYIKIKKETGDSEEAAKKAWRKIILGNVLGFLAGGHFYDLRQENQIMERFGPQIYNQLTKSMAKAAESELIKAKESEQAVDVQDDLPMDESKTKNKAKIAKVMGEFSKGDLMTSYGTKVTDPKQAVAIAYSEAGLSKKNN